VPMVFGSALTLATFILVVGVAQVSKFSLQIYCLGLHVGFSFEDWSAASVPPTQGCTTSVGMYHQRRTDSEGYCLYLQRRELIYKETGCTFHVGMPSESNCFHLQLRDAFRKLVFLPPE